MITVFDGVSPRSSCACRTMWSSIEPYTSLRRVCSRCTIRNGVRAYAVLSLDFFELVIDLDLQHSPVGQVQRGGVVRLGRGRVVGDDLLGLDPVRLVERPRVDGELHEVAVGVARVDRT